MKNKPLILSFLFIVSCSQLETKTANVVEFPYATELLKTVQMKSPGRAPASSLDPETVEVKSTRRIYFSSLYLQYLTLGHHVKTGQEISSCPQFHHDKVEIDTSSLPRLDVFKQAKVQEGMREYFPELVFNKDFSLKDYHRSLLVELHELCEMGSSDNYYKFDNLVTHHSGKESFHKRPEAMTSVLKIPIFANYYLIHMLEGHSEFTFTHPSEKTFIGLARADWFERYVARASRVRRDYLRNKMVKR